MYKALITDLDGTAIALGGDGSQVDHQTQAAIAEAIKAGYKLACATGRDWQLAKSVIKALGFIDPCIIEGGTRIIEPLDGTTLWHKAMEPGAGRRILDVFKQHSPGGILITSADHSRPVVAEVQAVPEQLSYIYLLAVDLAIAEIIRDQINQSGDSIAHLTTSWYSDNQVDIHVTHLEATKSQAMEIWLTMVGVTSYQTIGIGDSGNDLPIFKSAGLKVAVGNATPELKQLADYIAPASTNYGLKHVIDKFLLKQR